MAEVVKSCYMGHFTRLPKLPSVQLSHIVGRSSTVRTSYFLRYYALLMCTKSNSYVVVVKVGVVLLRFWFTAVVLVHFLCGFFLKLLIVSNFPTSTLIILFRQITSTAGTSVTYPRAKNIYTLYLFAWPSPWIRPCSSIATPLCSASCSKNRYKLIRSKCILYYMA